MVALASWYSVMHNFLFPWSFIPSLLAKSSPSNISWFIIAVIVYAIYGQAFCWNISNVSIEVGEIMPSFTYTDTATSIISIASIFWIFASLQDVIPSSVQATAKHAVFGKKFFSQASARISVFATQPIRLNSGFISAATFTYKKAFLCSVRWDSSDDSKPPENIANIDWWSICHAYNYRLSTPIPQ
jgi:hypothetical protein